MIIAIDGPAGAGKSTIAKKLAKALSITYLDTGAMYRAFAVKVHRLGLSVSDEPAIGALLAKTEISFLQDGGVERVRLDGEDVTALIREHHVSQIASDVSALPAVRYKMVELQRDLAKNTDTILDGRDIGTFVLPNADFKFFLTASLEERASRRYHQLKSRGASCDVNAIKQDIAERDRRDSERAVAPLKKADDAVEVDTTHLNIAQVVQKLLSYIRA